MINFYFSLSSLPGSRDEPGIIHEFFKGRKRMKTRNTVRGRTDEPGSRRRKKPERTNNSPRTDSVADTVGYHWRETSPTVYSRGDIILKERGSPIFLPICQTNTGRETLIPGISQVDELP